MASGGGESGRMKEGGGGGAEQRRAVAITRHRFIPVRDGRTRNEV